MTYRLSVALVFLLSGCAAGSDWVNPDVPKSQWSADYSACRRWAESQAGVTDRLEDSRSNDPFTQYDRGRAGKKVGALVAYCMEDKGYKKTK